MKRALAGRLVLALFIVAALVAFFLFNVGDWLTLDMLKARRGEFAALLDQRPFAVMAIYFLLYVTYRRALDSGRHGDDHRRRCCLRPGAGRDPRLLRLGPRRHPRFSGLALSVPGPGQDKVRPAARNDRPRPRSRRRPLSAFHQAQSGHSLFPGQPGDGADPASRVEIRFGQPDRHAARHLRLRKCGHPDRPHPNAQRHRLAGPDRLARAAQPVPCDRQASGGLAEDGSASTRVGAGRGATTAT